MNEKNKEKSFEQRETTLFGLNTKEINRALVVLLNCKNRILFSLRVRRNPGKLSV